MANNFSTPHSKGFTLIELLLILALIGILSVVALTTYFNTIGTFTYLGNYKAIVSNFRSARSMAITNTALNIDGVTVVPDRFGIHIHTTRGDENYHIEFFADTGITPLKFDKGDYVFQDKQYSINKKTYDLTAWDSQARNNEIPLPLTFFYETKTGNLYTYRETEAGEIILLPKADKNYRYIALQLEKPEGRYINRYLVVFQVSGLSEEFLNLP